MSARSDSGWPLPRALLKGPAAAALVPRGEGFRRAIRVSLSCYKVGRNRTDVTH